ncbi:MAG TPA: SAM-dependent methyltransferase [Blastocatellia bacterium]|nr:SAM-dependent methyltransferase [Blastocatellia bacterium]
MITVNPIGVVRNVRQTPEDDDWGKVASEIILNEELPEESLSEIETFSHIEVIYFFHLVDEQKIETGARHPRNNSQWPKVGIFAQRGKNRPNRLGATIVRLVRREGRTLLVAGLDAIDGTPVLDIKPVMREFLPHDEITQPDWATELMQNYWEKTK